jgi:hypothetical protein
MKQERVDKGMDKTWKIKQNRVDNRGGFLVDNRVDRVDKEHGQGGHEGGKVDRAAE